MTEAGRVFGQFAEQAVSAVEGARQALADLDGLAHGSLGASTTSNHACCPNRCGVRTKYPGMDVKLQIANLRSSRDESENASLILGSWAGMPFGPVRNVWQPECWMNSFLSSLPRTPGPDVATSSPSHLPPSRCRAGGGSATRSVTERALQRVEVSRGDGARPHRSDQAGRDGGAGRCVCLTLRGAGRNSRRAASRPSGCEGFAFSDISTSFTTRPGESRRAHAPSWSYSSRRHARGEGLRPLEEEIIRSLQRHHLPISRHPDLSVTIFVLVWRST